MAFGRRFETGRGDHRELRREAREVGCRRNDEEVSDEQVLPGHLLYEANRQAELRIRAGIEVLDEQFAVCQVRGDVSLQCLEVGNIDRTVHLAPGDVRFARRLADDEFVIRRSSRVCAGLADERAVLRQLPFLTPNGVFVERRRPQIAMNWAGGPDAMLVQPLILARLHSRHL
jgi:hypothetical protein